MISHNETAVSVEASDAQSTRRKLSSQKQNSDDIEGERTALTQQCRLRLVQSPEQELERKLAAQHVPRAIADALRQAGDQATSSMEHWVQERAVARGWARPALRRELEKKGLDAEVIDRSLSGLDEEQERENARSLVQRKLDQTQERVPRAKQMRRLVSLLSRRGYSSEVAFSVVGEALDRVNTGAAQERL